jgi:hypothetical protein
MVLPEPTAGEIQVDLLDDEDGLLGFHMADMVVDIQDGDSEPEEDLIAAATYEAFRTASSGRLLGTSPGDSSVHTLWDHDLRAQQPDRMQRAHDKTATWTDATSASYHGSNSPGAHSLLGFKHCMQGPARQRSRASHPGPVAECRQRQCAQPVKQQGEAPPEHAAWPGSADSHRWTPPHGPAPGVLAQTQPVNRCCNCPPASPCIYRTADAPSCFASTTHPYQYAIRTAWCSCSSLSPAHSLCAGPSK